MDAPHVPGRDLKAQAPGSELRVGLDIGHHTTVFQVASRLEEALLPRTYVIPSVVAYPGGRLGDPRTLLVGNEALLARDRCELIHPLDSGNARALKDFTAYLRQLMDPTGRREIWGVVSCMQAASPEEEKRVRALANEIFDRTSLLDPALLMATAYGCQDVARNSLWIDVGARSIRVTLIHGGSPETSDSIVIEGGGNALDERLQRAIHKRYPDLELTLLTVRQIKERLGYVAPASRPCKLVVSYDGTALELDIAPIVERACEPLVEQILEGMWQVLPRVSSDSAEELLGNIILAGGGAAIRGLRERLQMEVRRAHGSSANVRIADRTATLVANGAIRWAYFLKEEDWEIPVFSFAPAR